MRNETLTIVGIAFCINNDTIIQSFFQRGYNMAYFKHILLFSTCIIASFHLFAAEETNNIKEVLILIENARFKRPIYNGKNIDFDFNGINLTNIGNYQLATYKDFEYIAEIQNQNKNSIVQYPFILLTSGKKSPTVGIGFCYEIGSLKQDDNNAKCIVFFAPFELFEGDAKKFFIGHELKHITDIMHDIDTKNSVHTINTIESNTSSLLLSEKSLLSSSICTALGTKLGLMLVKKSSAALPCWLIAGALFCSYLLRRSYNYLASQSSHAIELSCDRFAVQIQQTPQEKIEIAQGLTILFGNPTPFRQWTDFIWRTLFTCAHPSNYCRIKRMNALISEQKALLQKQVAPFNV